MNPKTCPRCGTQATGNFCSSCGAALGGRFCAQCGADTEPGARYCDQCGSAVGVLSAGTGGGSAVLAGNRLAWWVAGGALVGLLLIVAYPVVREDRPDPSPAGAPAPAPAAAQPGQGASSVDLSSMTPRQAADRLFNRVMEADEAGDTAQVRGFLPMAISAYDLARPLDTDGAYHLAILQLTAGDFEGARAAALEGLEQRPDHLLNLAAAARAEQALGNEEAAREHYSRLLEVYRDERASGLQDYADHSVQLPELRAEAESFLAGG